MDALYDSIKDFDIASLLPELEGFLGSLRFWCGFAALLGPALLLIFGLLLLTKPDAGINRSLGFQLCREDAGKAVKKFVYHLAGLYWAGAGGALSVVTLLILLFTIGADALGMLTATAVCMIIQLAAIVAIRFLLKAAVKKQFGN